MMLVMGGEGAARGLAFLASLLIVKLATTEEMGLFSFFFSALAILVPLSELGLNVALVRFIAGAEGKGEVEVRRSILRTALFLRATLLAVVVGLAFTVAVWAMGALFHHPLYVLPLRLACFATIGLSIQSLATSYFQADQRFLGMFLLRASESVLRVLLIVGMIAAVGLHIDWVMVFFGIAPLVVGVVGLTGLLREVHGAEMHRGYVKQLLGYSRWIMVSTVATSLALQVDVMMLAGMVTPEKLGEYGAALRLIIPVQVVGNAVVTVLFPRFSKERTRAGLRILYYRFLRIAIPTSIVLAAGCLVGGPVLVRFFPQYGAFAPLVQILGVTYSVAVALNLGGLVLYSLDQPQVVAFVNIGQLVVSVTANLLLIPALGPTGAAISAAIVWTGGGLATNYLAIRQLRMDKP